MTDHLPTVTPPSELARKWLNDFHSPRGAMELAAPGEVALHVFDQAARWGADQELEACVAWVSQWCGRWPDGTRPEAELRAARRPKPPSLKERALESLHHLEAGCLPNIDLLRSALETIPDETP